MLCRKSSVKSGRGSAAVHLNVYDLTSVNGYAYWLGLGVYHSGVQVHGVEYAFGAHEYPTTGIFEGQPKQCEGFRFRKSILMGWTEMSPGEVRRVMEELADKYRGNAYNLITKNCNHLSSSNRFTNTSSNTSSSSSCSTPPVARADSRSGTPSAPACSPPPVARAGSRSRSSVPPIDS